MSYHANGQLWKKGNLLQHGEIVLDPPEKLWSAVFTQPPPKRAPKSIPREGLDKFLTDHLILHWPQLNWIQKEFTFYELQKIKAMSKAYLVNPSNSAF